MHRNLDEADGPRVGPAQTQRTGGTTNSSAPTDALIDDVLAGSEVHFALTALAWRGATADELRALMDRSTAKTARPDEWQNRYDDIPRLVRSAVERRLDEAKRVFGDPVEPPQAIPVGPFAVVSLPLMLPADFKRRPVVAREWIVADLMPRYEPTLLYGAGATGKSLILLQLAICMAAGLKWLDRDVPPGRVIMFTCEDSADELNRRASAILKSLGIEWDDCGERLALIPMRDSEADAVLATEQGGLLHTTQTYDALKATVGEFKPDLVIIDTLADAFAGDENQRAQAKQFVNRISRLRGQTTFVVTAHPSVSGMESGRGSSGSTGWPAAVRSHLFFGRVVEDGRERDPDVRRLSNLKGNYARQGAGEIEVCWSDGAFVASDGGIARNALDLADVDDLFIRLLRRYTDAGRYLNSTGGATYAPTQFATEQEAKSLRLDKRDMRDAMNRLFRAGRITTATRTVDRHERKYLAVVEGEPQPAPWLGEQNDSV